jgi:hypothetical protein
MNGRERESNAREIVKSIAGNAVYAISPQCRFRDCIFIQAHMRCGSTALSNILCSRPEISGYGEPHIRFDAPDALGRLVVNQVLRGEWTARATHLFAKNLHSRYDRDAHPRFFNARAIFIARRPAPTIRSIRRLFAALGRDEYRTDREAAEYYVGRMRVLLDHWARFDEGRRVGLTFDALMADPDAALATISSGLGFDPPLENRYVSKPASRERGAGDPRDSGRFTRIEPRSTARDDGALDALDLTDSLRCAAAEAYARYLDVVAPQPP